MRKRWRSIVAAGMASMLLAMGIGTPIQGNYVNAAEAEKEITLKGKTGQGTDEFMGDPQDVYWVDAAVQKPDNYTDIVGFKITATYVKHDNYGGGKEDDTFRCGMVLATRGAHEPEAYNFTYENGQTPEYDLSTQAIAGFGVGEAGWLSSMVFSNGISSDESAVDGDTVVLAYEGNTALFTKDDSIMTLVSFLGEFEYESIEWITGAPDPLEEEPWDKVETTQYLDVPTVSEDKQNGANYVDITIPDTGKESYPVILWIHGGGYITGDRKSCLLSDTKEYLLAQGYAFVSAEYTLTQKDDTAGGYGTGGMPQMLYDIKAAIRFLRANADEYKLNTDFIAAMGESAGAGLALLAGTSNGSTEHEDLSMGNEEYSSDVQAMVSFCGPTDFTGEYFSNMYAYVGNMMDDSSKTEELERLAELWSPTKLVNSDSPAMFLGYSKADTTVAFSHAEELLTAAKEYMDEENITTTFFNDGGHVDRSIFDTYTEYVTLTKFLDEQKTKFISEDKTGNKTDGETPTEDESTVKPMTFVVIAIVVIVVAGGVVITVRKKGGKNKGGEKW